MMAFLPSKPEPGQLPTWTSDVTGVTYELPDDMPSEIMDSDLEGNAFLKMAVMALLGETNFATENADRLRPFGAKRQSGLFKAWQAQVFGEGKAGPVTAGPSETIETPSSATSDSSTGSTYSP